MFRRTIHHQSLTVGEEVLRGAELEDALQRWLIELHRVFGPHPAGTFPAVMVDGTLQSHIALLAMARGSLSAALLDPSLPVRHLLSILQELGTKELHVIGQGDVPTSLERAGIVVKRLRPEGADSPQETPPRSEGELVIFTSGSTGRPKGVVLPWTAVENWIGWRASVVDIEEGRDITLGLAPLTFGAGVLICLDLYSGTSVVSMNPAEFSPRDLLARIARHKPTVLHLPAQLLRILALISDEEPNLRLDSVKLLNAGGGSVEAEWVHAFSVLLPDTCLLNHGLSATEAARALTFAAPISSLPLTGRVHVGTPRDDHEVRLEPFDGVPDTFMVFVSGPMARRYINDDDTAARWTEDSRGYRWWRSGDLVRWDNEQKGYLHVGREDDLVKVGGYLVSLGDVQMALLEDADIENVAVTAHQVAERTQLVAHLEWKEGVSPSPIAIKKRLSEKVPSWSIPTVFLDYPALPLTHRGKINRETLIGLAQGHLDALSSELTTAVGRG